MRIIRLAEHFTMRHWIGKTDLPTAAAEQTVKLAVLDAIIAIDRSPGRTWFGIETIIDNIGLKTVPVADGQFELLVTIALESMEKDLAKWVVDRLKKHNAILTISDNIANKLGTRPKVKFVMQQLGALDSNADSDPVSH